MDTINLLLKEIKSSEVNISLDLAYYLGELLFKNELSFFDSTSIEEVLMNKIINNSDLKLNVSDYRNDFLFIVSTPYLTGGHTRLMENLSLMIDDKKDLLITKSSSIATKQRLQTFFPDISECYRDKKESPIDFINKLVKKISKYNSIILNIHPQDIYTVIACKIAKTINTKQKIYFVNHADHAFNFGSSVADFWFEVSLYGRNIDKLKNINGKRSFLGIPINKPKHDFFKTVEYQKLKHVKYFISAASHLKFKPNNGSSIFPLINSILEKSDAKIEIIGAKALKDYWWWPLKLRSLDRLTLHKSLPYEEYINVSSKTDYYIDSHPVPGGTAFVEQFMQGKPCIGLKSSFFGYTPLEKLKRSTVAEVIEMLENPPKKEEIEEIQSLIFDVHGFTQVKKRFLGAINHDIVSVNPMSSHIDYQEYVTRNKNRILLSNDFLSYLYSFKKKLYLQIIISANPFLLLKLPLSRVFHAIKTKLKR